MTTGSAEMAKGYRMELIDKYEAIRIATRVSLHYVTIENTKASVRDIAEATGSIVVALNHAPLVDAEEVIRCKDCKYWNPIHKYCEGIGYWFGEEDSWGENGFCYKGEKKDEVEE